MTKDKKAIKSAAITETAVCELCHRRFVFKDLVRHVKSNHKDKETVQTLDQIKTFKSIQVLYGVCLQDKFYFGKQEFINIALKLLCKTPNEAVVESMGSMLQKHMINAEKVYWRYSWLALGKLGTVNLLPWLHLDCNLNYKKHMYQRQ